MRANEILDEQRAQNRPGRLGLLGANSMLRAIRLFMALGLLVVGAAGAAAYYITRRVRGHYFDSNGVRLHYTVEGHGEPAMLLHGFAVNADLNWRLSGVTRALAEEYRVIAMDLRGHGLSDKPADPAQYGLEMVEDVARLLDHMGIKKAHVAGYSLGGFIALRLAATHPERLLTVSPLGAGWERPDDSAFLSAVREIAAALESGRGVGPLSGSFGGERERPGVLHTFWVWFMTKFLNDGHALGNVVRSLPALAVGEEELTRLAVPVCSIVGSEDPLRPGVEALRELLPTAEVVIVEDADHIRTPQRAEFIDTLRGFLRRHGQPKSRDATERARAGQS